MIPSSVLLPPSVAEALSDHSLPASTRILMWYLCQRLDVHEWRAVKQGSLAHEARYKNSTVSGGLAQLVRCGYLDARNDERRLRAYRLLWTRLRPEDSLGSR